MRSLIIASDVLTEAQGTWSMSQCSSFEKSQGSGKKAQGSRRKPCLARLKALAPEKSEMPLRPRGVAMINDFPPFVLWLICHDIWPGDSPIEFPLVTLSSIQNCPLSLSVILYTASTSGSPNGVTTSILVRVTFVNLSFILFQNFVSGFVVIYLFKAPFNR